MSSHTPEDPLRPGRSSARDAFQVGGAFFLLVALGFVFAYQFVGPPPPERLVLATGAEGGGYRAFGQRYAEHLACSGIAVELRPTAGAVANFAALRSGEVDVALVQGGTAPADVGVFAKGIASLYHEPLWVFHRAELEVERLSDLAGLRIEVGEEGSGTRAVARDLLAGNGIGAGDATLRSSPAADGAAALLAGEADAALFVMAPTSGTIRRLMDAEGGALRLFDVERHLAYARHHGYLTHVVLGEGVLDLARNVPDRAVDLVAPTAMLVCREDLHPAVIQLFLQAAEEVHGKGDLLAAAGTFPSPDALDAPLAPAAKEYFENGQSFLYRVLPFGLAATLDRLKIMLLPLITLLLPLIRIAPPVYRWRIRRKIFLWYRYVERVEVHFRSEPQAREDCLARLDEIEDDVVESVDVPAAYQEELHNLRMHLGRVRQRIAESA